MNTIKKILKVSIILVIVFFVGVLFNFGFFRNITIVNNSGQDLYITPMGIQHLSNKEIALPRLTSGIFALSSKQAKEDIFIKNGETLKYKYCMDDVDIKKIKIKAGDRECFLKIKEDQKRINISKLNELNMV